MPNPREHVPTWVRAVAAQLETYLRVASTLAPPGSAIVAGQPTGWYAPSPDGPVEGRSPWVHMSDIAVDCVGETLVLTFAWNNAGDGSRYVLPMTTPEADGIAGADALITRLDYFLRLAVARQSHRRSRERGDVGCHGELTPVVADFTTPRWLRCSAFPAVFER